MSLRYVDFGGKFEAVVPWRIDEQEENKAVGRYQQALLKNYGSDYEVYRPGDKVELLLKEFEKVFCPIGLIRLVMLSMYLPIILICLVML